MAKPVSVRRNCRPAIYRLLEVQKLLCRALPSTFKTLYIAQREVKLPVNRMFRWAASVYLGWGMFDQVYTEFGLNPAPIHCNCLQCRCV